MNRKLSVRILLLAALCLLPFIAAADGTITLPASTKIIENEAFMNLRAEQVVLPEGLERIESRAFARSSITALSLPSSLTYIADDALEGAAVSSVTAKEGSYAYSWAYQHDYIHLQETPAEEFRYTVWGGGVTITGYKGTDTSVVIPATIDGKPVQTVGSRAFYSCTGLTSVTIPNSVTSIESRAFYGCTGLTSVTISNCVTSIGHEAFYKCTNLTSVAIPNSVTWIGEKAFYNCTGLTSMTIPNRVTTIGQNAFYKCTGLTSVTIPNSVTTIGNGVFDCCTGLTSVTIPNSVTTIGQAAFSGCTGLTSVTIPDSVTAIGSLAFSYCKGLTSVTIPNSVTTIGDSAFFACSGLTSVTIPNSVTAIGEGAFSSCRGLTSVTIPKSVTTIGEGAFRYCKELISVTIPNSVTTIGRVAFQYCTGLTSMTIPDSVTSIEESAFDGCTGLTSVTIQNGVTSIGNKAFYNCSSLTSMTIPNSVTTIGNEAFYKCTGLTSVTIQNGVTSIGHEAFYKCTSLTSMTIPNSVTTIGKYAFDKCTGMTSVTIQDGVVSIGECAFYGCTGLTSVTIPNSVTTIGEGAFSNCTGLTSVTIPNSVTTIGGSAFSSCKSLTSVTIPNSVTSIEGGAFSSCKSLTSVTIPNSVTSIGTNAFGGCTGLTSVTIPNSVTTIGEGAFSSCRGLTSVTIPKSVTTIEREVFESCTGLTSVTIPNSVTSIGVSAFSSCKSLTSVTIPNSVTSIGDSAFCYCKELISVTIPSSVTAISNYTFAGCTGMRSVTIPDSVTSIAEKAFYGCKLITVYTPADSYGAEWFHQMYRDVERKDMIPEPVYPEVNVFVEGTGTQLKAYQNEIDISITLNVPEGSQSTKLLELTDAYIYINGPDSLDFQFDLMDGIHTAYMDTEGHYGIMLPELTGTARATTVKCLCTYRPAADEEECLVQPFDIVFGCEEGISDTFGGFLVFDIKDAVPPPETEKAPEIDISVKEIEGADSDLGQRIEITVEIKEPSDVGSAAVKTLTNPYVYIKTPTCITAVFEEDNTHTAEPDGNGNVILPLPEISGKYGTAKVKCLLTYNPDLDSSASGQPVIRVFVNNDQSVQKQLNTTVDFEHFQLVNQPQIIEGDLKLEKGTYRYEKSVIHVKGDLIITNAATVEMNNAALTVDGEIKIGNHLFNDASKLDLSYTSVTAKKITVNARGRLAMYGSNCIVQVESFVFNADQANFGLEGGWIIASQMVDVNKNFQSRFDHTIQLDGPKLKVEKGAAAGRLVVNCDLQKLEWAKDLADLLSVAKVVITDNSLKTLTEATASFLQDLYKVNNNVQTFKVEADELENWNLQFQPIYVSEEKEGWKDYAAYAVLQWVAAKVKEGDTNFDNLNNLYANLVSVLQNGKELSLNYGGQSYKAKINTVAALGMGDHVAGDGVVIMEIGGVKNITYTFSLSKSGIKMSQDQLAKLGKQSLYKELTEAVDKAANSIPYIGEGVAKAAKIYEMALYEDIELPKAMLAASTQFAYDELLKLFPPVKKYVDFFATAYGKVKNVEGDFTKVRGYFNEVKDIVIGNKTIKTVFEVHGEELTNAALKYIQNELIKLSGL